MTDSSQTGPKYDCKDIATQPFSASECIDVCSCLLRSLVPPWPIVMSWLCLIQKPKWDPFGNLLTMEMLLSTSYDKQTYTS